MLPTITTNAAQNPSQQGGDLGCEQENEQEMDTKGFAVSISRSSVSQDYSFPCAQGTEYLMAKEVGGT
jgi:hypothetical protein